MKENCHSSRTSDVLTSSSQRVHRRSWLRNKAANSKTCLLNIETKACKLTPDNGQFRATFELCLRKTASRRTQLSNMKLIYFISYRRLENSVDMCLPKFDLYRGTIAPNFLITIQTNS